MKIGRRDFLKMAGVIGAGAVISLYTFDIAKVFAQATDGSVHVVWLQGAGDTGCTISLLQGVDPDLVDVITEFRLSIDFHPTLMIPAGDEALESLEDAAEGITPLDVLIVEGAVPKGNYCTVGEIAGTPVPFEDWVRVLGDKAKYIVAVGTCAAFGGIPAAIPNPTGCTSVAEALGKELREIINIAGCPPHPDWMTLTLATVLSGVMPRLDRYGRPKEFFKNKIHENCPLRRRYEEEKFASYPSDDGCLYKIGCKGKDPGARGDCPVRLWNNKTSCCTAGKWVDEDTQLYPAGAPCIGCTEPEFPEYPWSPFYERVGGKEKR
jgi:hydrogenase small subunit